MATIDKFGGLHAQKAGEVSVSVYSWDDANPSAKNDGPEYLTQGIQNAVKLTITE